MDAIEMIARCMTQSEPWTPQGELGHESPADQDWINMKMLALPIPEEPMGGAA